MAKKTGKAAGKTASKAKPAAKASKPAKITGASTPRKKTEIFNTIAEHNELSRKQVAGVFQTMQDMIAADLKKGTVFAVPGLMKITVNRKPATKAREGINPFTGEKQMFKAKPARNVIKVRPLKNLKSMV